MKRPLVVRGGVGGAQNIPLMSLVIRHWGHTGAKQGPLLHYQTKLTFDPGVAVMGHMRAKANIKFLQPSTQMPNWLSFVDRHREIDFVNLGANGGN